VTDRSYTLFAGASARVENDERDAGHERDQDRDDGGPEQDIGHGRGRHGLPGGNGKGGSVGPNGVSITRRSPRLRWRRAAPRCG
jgi:hypothetical protein